MRRMLPVLVCAALMELGWLALWPLSTTLSHSVLFTSMILESHPTLHAIARLLPGWSDITLTDPLGSPIYVGPATLLALLMLALMAVYVAAMFLLERTAMHQPSAQAVILASTLLFGATLVAMPGLFSQDVFSYIAYGRLAADYGLNPYIWPPSVLRDPVVSWVADIWRTYPSPYGPLWVDVQWLLARLAGRLSLTDQALLYRALASVLLLINLGVAWRLLGRVTPLSPAQRVTALAALAWNPLVLFEIVGNAHNDVLMVTFSLLGLLLFRQSSRGVTATIALALGAVVKYLSGLGLIWLGLAAAARARSWSRRAVRLGLLVLLALGIALTLFAPWLELPDSLDPLLNETARVGYVNSLPDTLVLMLSSAFNFPLDPARAAERVLTLAGFAVYLLWEARQVWCEPSRGAVARALARSSLLYVLVVSTSVQTWYFCLPVSIALTLGWRRRIARLSLAYSALALPALYLSYYLRDLTPGWIFVVYACAPLLLFTRRWTRPGVPPRPAQQHPSRPSTSPTPASSAPARSARVLRPVAATVRRLRSRPATPAQ